MPILIAHRGNTNGPKKEFENTPTYIQEALDKGYNVEIDVWVINDEVYLGHDSPDYKISLLFLMNDKLWCHAKNFEALLLMTKNKNTIHYFSHDSDPYVVTSKGIIWGFPNGKLSEESVCVMPEMYERLIDIELKNVLGLCSDYVDEYVK